MATKKRNFTRWNSKDTKTVVDYFKHYVSNANNRLPRKADICEFKALNNTILHDWQIIRTKVLNEQKAYTKRKRLRLQDLQAV